MIPLITSFDVSRIAAIVLLVVFASVSVFLITKAVIYTIRQQKYNSAELPDLGFDDEGEEVGDAPGGIESYDPDQLGAAFALDDEDED